ncbi:amidase [Sneathiella marina]|uniref:Amidase n=1 Tax=Sneathiella marina TaxID=2950108 RepID=A0ABY4W200_9PROT|nr:amidase [Sneathiella marina]USG60997.1 amidase [Sneathiella marina]
MSFETLKAVSEKLGSGEISSFELCSELFSIIRRLNPSIGAYSQLLPETALEEAKASDTRRQQGVSKGLLDGVPIAIKDLIDTSPAICSAGLASRSGHQPALDAPVVKALRGAGAVVIGVTETDPGAFSTDTPNVINPLAPNRTVGGSSGGSGAVIAAGMAYAALGTDTGGSIRIPAACCSVYGFKPTWGRVDALGVFPLAPSLDHVGPMARSVEDLQILQSIIDPKFEKPDTRVPLQHIRLGMPVVFFQDADPDIRAAMEQVACALVVEGIEMRNVTLPDPDQVMNFHMINLSREAADFHIAHFPGDWPDYPEVARNTVEFGRDLTVEMCNEAERLRYNAYLTVDSILKEVDAIILPTLPTDSPLRGEMAVQVGGVSRSKLEVTVRYTSLFNQTGHPTVSMPAVLRPDGRAVSIQLVGRCEGDGDILMIARQLEQLFSIRPHYQAITQCQLAEINSVRSGL